MHPNTNLDKRLHYTFKSHGLYALGFSKSAYDNFSSPGAPTKFDVNAHLTASATCTYACQT